MKHHAAKQRGFTLIELLVVLVIVGIITMVAVLAFGDFGHGRAEKIRVETFARMIRAAQSQAILTPAVLGLMITPKGYEFYQWVTDQNTSDGHTSQWQPLSGSVLSRPSAFDDWFDVHVKTISGYDANTEDTHVHPAIVFLPSGYVTAFEVALKGKGHDFLVIVENNGNVTIK